jgi:Cu+-exporting ATPase
MSTADIVVLVAEVAVIAGLGWYFIGPRRARIAQLDEGVQRVEVTVRGGTPAGLAKAIRALGNRASPASGGDVGPRRCSCSRQEE